METIEDIRDLPGIDVDAIHIWGLHVPDLRDRIKALEKALSEREREKANRFHREIDHLSSIAARGALRILLSGYTGVPATELAFRYAESGKPYLSFGADFQTVQGGQGCPLGAIAFNVSHSGDWVVLAFGRNRSVGVDIEKIKKDIDVRSLAVRFYAPPEMELIQAATDPHTIFFQIWVRKEAYVKACGTTLFKALGSFSVPVEDGRLPETGERDGWYFHGLEAGSKYAAAVVTDRKLASVPCYDFGGLKWRN